MVREKERKTRQKKINYSLLLFFSFPFFPFFPFFLFFVLSHLFIFVGTFADGFFVRVFSGVARNQELVYDHIAVKWTKCICARSLKQILMVSE